MTDNPWFLFVAIPLMGYVIGATPFGYIIARCKGVDIRKVGSGNVGATNVGRVLGKPWGYLCFALDVLKGLTPTLGVWLVLKDQAAFPTLVHQGAWLGAGLGAVLGHVFTFWLGFRGGKGVATALGVVLGIYPYFTVPGLAAFGLWIVVTVASRYVSLGSVVAALAFVPIFAVMNRSRVMELWPLLTFASAIAVLILVRHRANIGRLINGTENKIGLKGKPPPQERS